MFSSNKEVCYTVEQHREADLYGASCLKWQDKDIFRK